MMLAFLRHLTLYTSGINILIFATFCVIAICIRCFSRTFFRVLLALIVLLFEFFRLFLSLHHGLYVPTWYHLVSYICWFIIGVAWVSLVHYGMRIIAEENQVSPPPLPG